MRKSVKRRLRAEFEEMRIIAGKWRSRRIERPESDRTRPVPDRVRESIFNMLGVIYETPGELPPIRVADVFAGSGSFGLEALSRGVASCDFFEKDPIAIDVLRRNIASLGAEEATAIRVGNAWKTAMSTSDTRAFDLVFLDPPYTDAEDVSEAGKVGLFLTDLPRLETGQLVVLHHPANVDFNKLRASDWRIVDHRHIGTNGVTVFAR